MAQSGATRRFERRGSGCHSYYRSADGIRLRAPRAAKGSNRARLHAITLLIAHQMVRDLRELGGKVDVLTVPNLCPLDVSPYDFCALTN